MSICILRSFEIYKNIIEGDDSLEYAKLILDYDKSVFNFVRDENELAAALASRKRKNDGRIPIADNVLRSKLGIKELPKKLPEYKDTTYDII